MEIKSLLNFIYVWLGVLFVWIGAFALYGCYPQCCPFAIASGVSALVMWATSANIRDILKH